MNTFCEKCGTQLRPQAKFCQTCGASQVAGQTATNTQTNNGPFNGSGNPGFLTSYKAWFTNSQCIGRADYWYFYGVLVVFNILVNLIFGDDSTITNAVYVFVFVMTWIGGVKRLHDAGHNGWTLLIPFVNIIYLCQPTDWSQTQWSRRNVEQ